MSTDMFAATMRPGRLIGREAELEQVRKAIFPGDKAVRIVFIQGRGGLGKTRLLEEILCCLRHPSVMGDKESRWKCADWRVHGNVLSLGMIDLMDIQLHSVGNFVEVVSERFAEVGSILDEYITARSRHKLLVQSGADFRHAQEAGEKALEVFQKEYARIAKKRRIVWLIDTAEQLDFVTSAWLREQDDPTEPGKKLLRPEEVRYQTQQWLADVIGSHLFPNTTFIFAGREEEGEAFFANVHKAATKADVQITPLLLGPFDTATLVQDFFQQLAQDWRRRAQEAPAKNDKEAAEALAEELEEWAKDEERMRVLWLYTGGQPVLLSIFTELIVQRSTAIPYQLNLSFADVVTQVGTDDPTKPTDDLRWEQWQIEESFITLLFLEEADTPSSLARRILLHLVRSPRGLSVPQLHFLLDNPDNISAEKWQANPHREEEIRTTLEQWMQRSALLKPRQNGFGLQDEVYRIFAEHMAPHVTPPLPILALWERRVTDEQQRARYDRLLAVEKKERGDQYRALRAWAQIQVSSLQTEQKRLRQEEERDLEIRATSISVTQPRLLQFRRLDQQERQHQWDTYAQLGLWQLEYMHYSLQLDFEYHFNVTYADAADSLVRGYDEDRSIVVQAETRRLLNDRYGTRFMHWGNRQRTVDRGETPIQVMLRVVEQEEVTRWLERLIYIRREYSRAIAFASGARQAVVQMSQNTKQEIVIKDSWQHTLLQGEWRSWEKYAQILQSQNIEEAVHDLNKVVSELTELSKKKVGKIVFPNRGLLGEEGFKGHPAETRLRRLISMAYNYMGYGEAQLRNFRKAAEYYGKALYYVRELGYDAHRAYVLNNLARVESELGRRGRPLRLCFDALNLRRKLGTDLPIALSYSTLALIYNDQNRPESAWKAAVKATAYARRVDDPRTLGLALKHLGEALRRLANQSTQLDRLGQIQVETPDMMYDAALDMLLEGKQLFQQERISSEKLRLAEYQIELGCLYRDWLQITQKNTSEWRSTFHKAVSALQEAADIAQDRNVPHMQVDALTNLAWTHYRANLMEKVASYISDASTLIDARAFLQRDKNPPAYDTFEPFIFFQISKMRHLEGRVAMERFRQRADVFKQEFPNEQERLRRKQEVHKDPASKAYLKEAADKFVQAIIYSQLYSGRAGILSKIMDSLYSNLIRFNLQELDDFTQYARQFHKQYHGNDLSMERFGVGEFLEESFGVSFNGKE